MSSMGREQKPTTLFSLLLLCSLLLITMVIGTESRPFGGSKLNKDVNAGEVEGLVGGFSLQAVKKSGPSPGTGHKYENFQIEGEATRSVPSPGEVHEHAINGNKP
ncbi:hypothetical protein SADUNF_Sadunf09G0077200 [Salix dunnii]|uniref:Uncharacterized protein n=1 Tax=Salix dunnii TaxID=1413687 RepID=A0A835JVZ1_9ROSI|nr:hypothetical protein SADUNF_Sadunf09G0077200 [Salix dunnii]